MATPKNSAKPLGYENTPHNGVYLTYAYAPALSPANKAVDLLGVVANSLVCSRLELACGAMPIR